MTPARQVKKDAQISIRLTQADIEAVQKAAATLWPGAPVSLSAAILAFAKLKAAEVLKGKK